MKRYILAAVTVTTAYGFIFHDNGYSQAAPQQEAVVQSVLDSPPPPKTWKPSRAHVKAERQLAALIFGECRGCSIDGMRAVGHVALNRAKSGLDSRYGKGLFGVIAKRKQFSCFNKNDPNRIVIEKALSGKLDKDSYDGVKWTVALEVAHELMHRNTPDPTNGSVFYHTYAIKPAWIKDRGMVRVAKIDGHIFYRKEV